MYQASQVVDVIIVCAQWPVSPPARRPNTCVGLCARAGPRASRAMCVARSRRVVAACFGCARRRRSSATTAGRCAATHPDSTGGRGDVMGRMATPSCRACLSTAAQTPECCSRGTCATGTRAGNARRAHDEPRRRPQSCGGARHLLTPRTVAARQDSRKLRRAVRPGQHGKAACAAPPARQQHSPYRGTLGGRPHRAHTSVLRIAAA